MVIRSILNSFKIHIKSCQIYQRNVIRIQYLDRLISIVWLINIFYVVLTLLIDENYPLICPPIIVITSSTQISRGVIGMPCSWKLSYHYIKTLTGEVTTKEMNVVLRFSSFGKEDSLKGDHSNGWIYEFASIFSIECKGD